MNGLTILHTSVTNMVLRYKTALEFFVVTYHFDARVEIVIHIWPENIPSIQFSASTFQAELRWMSCFKDI